MMYSIKMTGTKPFKGLVLRASAGALINPVPASSFGLLACTGESAITHANPTAKMAGDFSVTWTAPASGMVTFTGIIVGSRPNQTACDYGAHAVTIGVAPPPTTTTAPPPPTAAPVTTFTFTTQPLAPKNVVSTTMAPEVAWTGVSAAAVATNDAMSITSTVMGIGKTAPLYFADFGLQTTANGLVVSGIAVTVARDAAGGASCVDEQLGVALAARGPIVASNVAAARDAWPAATTPTVFGNASFAFGLAPTDAAGSAVAVPAFGVLLGASNTANATCVFNVNQVSLVLTVQTSIVLIGVRRNATLPLFVVRVE
jgi:hypothetical protein